MRERELDALLSALGHRILQRVVNHFRLGINFILKETELMTTAQEIMDIAADLQTTINNINLKLDDVKTKIDALEAGSVISQAQLDELGASLAAAKSEAVAVLGEAGDLAAPKPA